MVAQRYCCVTACYNYLKPGSKITFHLPSKTVLDAWREALGMPTLHLRSCVCSEHFAADQFRLVGDEWVLNPAATPVVKLPARWVKQYENSQKRKQEESKIQAKHALLLAQHEKMILRKEVESERHKRHQTQKVEGQVLDLDELQHGNDEQNLETRGGKARAVNSINKINIGPQSAMGFVRKTEKESLSTPKVSPKKSLITRSTLTKKYFDEELTFEVMTSDADQEFVAYWVTETEPIKDVEEESFIPPPLGNNIYKHIPDNVKVDAEDDDNHYEISLPTFKTDFLTFIGENGEKTMRQPVKSDVNTPQVESPKYRSVECQTEDDDKLEKEMKNEAARQALKPIQRIARFKEILRDPFVVRIDDSIADTLIHDELEAESSKDATQKTGKVTIKLPKSTIKVLRPIFSSSLSFEVPAIKSFPKKVSEIPIDAKESEMKDIIQEQTKKFVALCLPEVFNKRDCHLVVETKPADSKKQTQTEAQVMTQKEWDLKTLRKKIVKDSKVRKRHNTMLRRRRRSWLVQTKAESARLEILNKLLKEKLKNSKKELKCFLTNRK